MKLSVKLLILLLLIPFLAHAEKETKLYVSSNFPSKDFEVVPLAKMNWSESAKKTEALQLEQLKTRGYIEEDSEYPRKLISMTHKDSLLWATASDNNNPYDTHLKKDISQIRLAFPYKGIISTESNEVFAYAAIGTWKDNGWTGIKEFFGKKGVGICTLSTYHTKLSNMRTRVVAEFARYDVNNKLTTVVVSGNSNSGFLYRIRWRDSFLIRDLECAKMDYKPEITNELVAYSRILDKETGTVINNT
jgi:hypothetical protein